MLGLTTTMSIDNLTSYLCNTETPEPTGSGTFLSLPAFL